MKRFPLYAFVSVLCITSASFTAQEGTFPVIFKNLAAETFADSQIYIYSMGMTDGKWCYMTKDGTMLPMNPADETAPGHLTKNGRNYANYAFKLSEAGNFRIPPSVGGGRIYISCGEPMYIPVYQNGWGGPDPNNPNDPNDGIYYDWFEYTYVYNKIPFGGNTTQVDIFGFPIVAVVRQDASNYQDSCGIPMARDEFMEYYNSRVSEPFRQCVKKCRIVAPRSASHFQKGGAFENYLQPVIDSLWNYYSVNTLEVNNNGWKCFGKVVNGIMQFTGAESGSMDKPTTSEVWGCVGFPGQIGASFSAALNRGVAANGPDWYNAATYYKRSSFRNEFADVLHQVSIYNLAYGFGYDDVNNQSSVLIVGNSKPLTSLTLTIQPFVSSGGPNAVLKRQDRAGALSSVKYVTGSRVVLRDAAMVKEVQLTSLNGRTLTRASATGNAIDLSGMANGAYVLRITDKAGMISTTTFIKRN